jgi:hypothetical protein
VSPSSQISMAGSCATATSKSRRLPTALARNISICPRCFAGSSDGFAAINRVPFSPFACAATFEMPVAK